MQTLIRHPYNWYSTCRWWSYCDPLQYCNIVIYCTLSSHIAVMIGCLVTDVKDVTELAPLLFVPQLLFAGDFFACISSPVICERTRSLYLICYSRYHLIIAWHGTDEQDDIFFFLLLSFHSWITFQSILFTKDFSSGHRWFLSSSDGLNIYVQLSTPLIWCCWLSSMCWISLAKETLQWIVRTCW
jgi:hypothetical protein